MKNLTDEANIKKKQIIAKALEKFEADGLEKTSVRDLCKYAGVNSASLYYYFKSKDDVVIECIKYEIEIIELCIADSIKKNHNVRDFLDAIFTGAMDNSNGIRFIAQVLASPNHFSDCRNEIVLLHKEYENFARQISNEYNLVFERFKALLFNYLTIIYDYLIKGDEEYFKVLSSALHGGLNECYIKKEKVNGGEE